MTKVRTQPVQPIDVIDRAPLTERLAALRVALQSVPEHDREPIALRLFEIASDARVPIRTGAASPIELLTDLSKRRRLRIAEEAMLALLTNWSAIPESTRPLIGGLPRQRWLRIATRAAESELPEHRAAVCKFAHDTADPGFASIVCALLPDSDRTVRLDADRALMRLVMTMLTHVPSEHLGEEFASIAARKRIPLPAEHGVIELERVELCRQLADAAWSFADHRCRAPLIGSLLVLDRLPSGVLERSVAQRIRRLLKERNHPSHTPIRSVLRGTPSPLLRERALRWLVVEPVASTCVDRLSSADSLDEHEVVLKRAYLAMRPARARKLRSVRVIGDAERSPIPSAKSLAALSPESRRGVVRLASLAGLEESARRVALEPMLADDDALARLAGAHMAHHADLPDYTYDPSAEIARSASIRWSSLGVPAPIPGTAAWNRRSELSTRLLRSPHADVRATARAEQDRLDPFSGSPTARVIARRFLDRDPVAFVRSVRDQLAQPAGALSGLMLVRHLDLCERFEMDLVDLATTHAEDRVRATAVAALGTIDSETARRVVSASLHAPDPRVRSNAIESILPSPEVLLEYKDDQSHRVRASAVRRVLSLEDLPVENGQAAGQALARLITDDRHGHRLSGVWAAERVLRHDRRDTIGPAWRSAVKGIIDAAENDQDQRIRERATRCARILKSRPDAQAQGAA
ncbi:MAG: HEAT repeat domain-containing protein [Phycisphaerales bacterium]